MMVLTGEAAKVMFGVWVVVLCEIVIPLHCGNDAVLCLLWQRGDARCEDHTTACECAPCVIIQFRNLVQLLLHHHRHCLHYCTQFMATAQYGRPENHT